MIFRVIIFAVAVVLAGFLVFAEPLAGTGRSGMIALAITLVVVSLWATVLVPEHTAALVLFALAMLTQVAPPQVVFAGFYSPALWLVFAGLVIGLCAKKTGLGEWVAGHVLRRVGHGYPSIIVAIIAGTLLLAFIVPSSMGRIVLVMPVALGLADRLGFGPTDKGRIGLVMATIVGCYALPMTILSANLPNIILLGAADSMYGEKIYYWDFLMWHFPVMGILRGLLLAGLIVVLLPAKVAHVDEQSATPLSRDGRRLLVIVLLALGMWMTDSLHGISPGWVGLTAALICMLPGIGLLPAKAIDDVSFSAILYVAGAIGIGGIISHTGAGEAIASIVLGFLQLQPGDLVVNTGAVVGLSMGSVVLATTGGAVATITPMAQTIADATGLPLFTVLMLFATGYSTPVFAYLSAPIIFGLRLGGVSIAQGTIWFLWSALLTVVILYPINFLWWRLIGVLS